MTTKLQQYLDAKKLCDDLGAERNKLRNEFDLLEDKALNDATAPILDQLTKARNKASDDFHASMPDELARLEKLQQDHRAAERAFGEMQYNCNHHDENGVLALVPEYHWSEETVKPDLKCGICGETWK